MRFRIIHTKGLLFSVNQAMEIVRNALTIGRKKYDFLWKISVHHYLHSARLCECEKLHVQIHLGVMHKIVVCVLFSL